MRRRQLARQEYFHRAMTDPPKTVKQAVQRVVDLETAIESALRGGFCPACGLKFGRGARSHFEKCGGASVRLSDDGAPDQD